MAHDENQSLSDLRGWEITVEEVSAGVYRVRAARYGQVRYEERGGDPERLRRKCGDYVRRIC